MSFNLCHTAFLGRSALRGFAANQWCYQLPLQEQCSTHFVTNVHAVGSGKCDTGCFLCGWNASIDTCEPDARGTFYDCYSALVPRPPDAPLNPPFHPPSKPPPLSPLPPANPPLPPLSPKSASSSKTAIAAAVPSVAGLIIVIAVALYWRRRKRARNRAPSTTLSAAPAGPANSDNSV